MIGLRRTMTPPGLAVAAAVVAVTALAAQSAVGASTSPTPEGPSPTGQPPPASPPAPATAAQVDPYASYVAPTGPVLSLRRIRKLALREGARDADPRPASISTAKGPLLLALNVMSSHSAPTTAPAAMTDGQRAAMEASVYLIEMQGSFTLADARVRRGEPAPQGTVLRLIVDAHSGSVEGRSLSTEIEAPLSNLGRVEELG
jgi:hypothetical protein